MARPKRTLEEEWNAIPQTAIVKARYAGPRQEFVLKYEGVQFYQGEVSPQEYMYGIITINTELFSKLSNNTLDEHPFGSLYQYYTHGTNQMFGYLECAAQVELPSSSDPAKGFGTLAMKADKMHSAWSARRAKVIDNILEEQAYGKYHAGLLGIAMNRAIAHERYEYCAGLRDALKNMREET